MRGVGYKESGNVGWGCTAVAVGEHLVPIPADCTEVDRIDPEECRAMCDGSESFKKVRM
jgi:hypothetical protein